jgi:hypothetical protein
MAEKAAKKPAAPADPEGQGRVRLAAHPRAKRHIALAKSWGGLLGFFGGLYIAMGAGLSTPDAISRALICGIAFYVLAWAGAVAIWGQLAIGEVHAQRRALQDEHERRMAEREAALADRRAASS